jgi:hypothetical protein
VVAAASQRPRDRPRCRAYRGLALWAAADRVRNREELLAATENDLAKIKASVAAGRCPRTRKVSVLGTLRMSVLGC